MDAELCAAMNEQTESRSETELIQSLREKIQLDPQEVAQCAYAVWESCGRPDGQDQANWFQAEAQLLFDAAQDRGLLAATGGAPATARAHPRGMKSTRTTRASSQSRKKTARRTGP